MNTQKFRARFLVVLAALLFLAVPWDSSAQPRIVGAIPQVTGPHRFREVTVSFSEPVKAESAAAVGNYSFDGGTVVLSGVLANATNVVLSTSRLSLGNTYGLTVKGIEGTDGKVMMAEARIQVAARLFLPLDFGQETSGFQDDFDGLVRNPSWVSRGGAEDLYLQTNGVLTVPTLIGDPNHLLYEAPGYSAETQEVLARMRVKSFADGSRAGIAVASNPAATHAGEAINLVFSPSARDRGTGTPRLRLLNDYQAWGPVIVETNGEELVWQPNAWYWVRLRQDRKSPVGEPNIHAKAWLADGLTPEPERWLANWTQEGRSGFAGIEATTGANVEFEVDYFLLKAGGLPRITPVAEVFSTAPGIIITRDAKSATVGPGGLARFSVEAIGQYVDHLQFQWEMARAGATEFTAIPGGINSDYSASAAVMADSGSRFRCVVSVAGQAEIARTSAEASLFVDDVPPRLVSAQTFLNPRQVIVRFTKPVGAAISEANFSIDKAVHVTGVAFGSHPTRLVLETSANVSGSNQVLTVTGVRDSLGNVIAANSRVPIVEFHPEVTQHDILPVLYLRCTVCHGLRKREGDLDLRTKASMLAGGKSGPAFVPAEPDASLMYKRVVSGECPPARRVVEVSVKPMESNEIEMLKKWIETDAPEVPDAAVAVGEAAPRAKEADRQFWAFQQPKVTPIPLVKHGERVRTAIDSFVLRKLEEKGLSFAPEAERQVLMRRACLDLTGLPPEPDEAEAFAADPDPLAYEKMIDRLLASPRYGERWGRHWLDVAGYADSEGKREQDELRPDAYRYRDYVIRSFNADKPYDRFLQEQIAGDELADYENAKEISEEMYDNLAATGFLRMAPDSTVANITAFVPDRLDIIADEIQTLGSGVMGLTIGCARCHSHKFDPIPQREYYALCAVFKGAYDEHDWLIPNQRRLPYVSTRERREWEANANRIKTAVEALKVSLQDKDAESKKAVEKQIADLEAQRQPEPMIRALWDRGEPFPEYLLKRGNYLTPQGLVEPAVISVLAHGNGALEIKPPWPGAKKTGRRLAFAKWLTSPGHPLTARVMVNRIWKHHLENGIVKSLGNFGRVGIPPTHPELLDFLACEFVHQGWSMKAMHRLIMTSSVYRQSSQPSPEAQRADPGNDWLSHFPLKRMEAEVLADTLLLVAGRLDETRFGPPDSVQVRGDGLVTAVGTGRGWRRSIYVRQRRKEIPSILETFDLPQMNPNCLGRWNSVVPTQALHLMNNGLIHELADSLAARVVAESGPNCTNQIRRLYRIALNRLPSPEEEAATLASLERLTAKWASAGGEAKTAEPAPSQRALANVCHAIINSAEFVFVD